MQLKIYNHIIKPDLPGILEALQKEAQKGFNKFDFIPRVQNGNIKVVCPFHDDHRPSAFIYAGTEGDTVFGTFHCFSCGKKAALPVFCNRITHRPDFCEWGNQWLIDNFGQEFQEGPSVELPEIILGSSKQNKYIDESILENYRYIHPYLLARGIDPEVIKKFEVGWNPQTDAVTFPIRDEHGKLIGVTERSVKSKRFSIPEGMGKPVYLLYHIIKEGITSVHVCESQINTLTLWSWGIPAIGLLGTGTKDQYEILKKSGIRSYHLCFDGDDAGAKGANRFHDAMYQTGCFIERVALPPFKDVNDLTRENFLNLWRS